MALFHVLFKIILCAFCFLGIVRGQENPEDVDPDILLDLDEILIKHGYPVEKYEITTQDGYILALFRVPHGKGGSGVNKKPILMQHGLFGSPFNFVFIEYYNKSMAGYFADRGYDVWLGSTRGGRYNRKHVKLDPNKAKFWKFSWHEIGMYDVPAMIDFILEKTKKKKIYYIGHSQGGTVFYVMNSMKPEYQKKIIQASLLAPAGFMNNFNNSLTNPLVKRHKMIYAHRTFFRRTGMIIQDVVFDFGKKKNMQIYGAVEPPDYPVQEIEIPVAIYYSKNDNLAFWQDQENMCRALKNCTRLYLMPNLKFTHFDFLLSFDENELHGPVINYMNTFDSN